MTKEELFEDLVDGVCGDILKSPEFETLLEVVDNIDYIGVRPIGEIMDAVFFLSWLPPNVEIVGNIFDNKELLTR